MFTQQPWGHKIVNNRTTIKVFFYNWLLNAEKKHKLNSKFWNGGILYWDVKSINLRR